MTPLSLIGLASSLSLLSGWRVYLCVAATGLAMRFGAIAAPHAIPSLDILASPWVIGAAATGAVAEFFADKVMWLDSFWDAVHTVVRPLGGALVALAVVDPADPRWQIVAFLLGGGASLVTHGAKAATRAVVNVSPEPVSNVVVSTGEDVSVLGLLALAMTHPLLAGAVATVVLVASVALLLFARRLSRRLLGPAPA